MIIHSKGPPLSSGRGTLGTRTSRLALLVLVLVLSVYSYRQRVLASGVSPTAIVVYGQGGSFTSNTANNAGVSATSMNNILTGMVLDSSGNLYVADTANNRVLYYPAGSTSATRVYGQGGSFTSNLANNGGLSATSLNRPEGVALDSSSNLYVADSQNNRVLFYSAGSTTATRVYGQGGSFTSNSSGTSATTLNKPWGVVLDSNGNLYVEDSGNNRVLSYAAGSTSATGVYGQGGSFTSNNPGTSATTLNQPEGVALDSNGNLYVADTANNRVLSYPAGSTTATGVYGQGGSFTAHAPGTSATTLNKPAAVALDSSGNLYVADFQNNRVLYYPAGNTTASRVYGQAGSFTSNTGNTVTASGLSNPDALALQSNGNIYIADEHNSRVLKFQTALSVSSQPPAGTPAGTTFSTTYSLIDVGSGSTFSDFTGSVTLAIQPGTGTSGALLSGTTTVNAVSGVATFSTLSINQAGSGYVLTGSSPGVGSGTTNSFTITGSLSQSISSSPAYSSTLNGTDQTLTAPLGVSVSDSRGTGAGWNLLVSATQFTTGSHTLPTTALSVTAASSACSSSCTLPTNSVSYPLTVPLTPSSVKAYNAAANTGTGSMVVTLTLALVVPANTYVGTYSSTLTVSSASGP